MSTPKTILVPVDFSEPSKRALEQAVELAVALNATVHVVHAFEVPTLGFPDGVVLATAEWTGHIVNAAQQALNELVAPYKGSGAAISSLLVQGEPRETILEKAKALHANLIVMGTHGRRGLSRALLGSVTQGIVRASPIPVLVVPESGEAA